MPALLAGGKVLLSTGTKPLQDQLFRKDLPAVLDALHINAATALLKGRANYLCLHRMARAESEGLLPTREDVVHFGRSCALPRPRRPVIAPSWRACPENAAIWPLVTSTRDNCLGAECPRFGECFVYKARREAQAADIVVVNHHLFHGGSRVSRRFDSRLPADGQHGDSGRGASAASIAADFFGDFTVARTAARSRP